MKYFKFLIFILFFNCNLNNKLELYGISDLRIKINSIKINETNENDVINLIGPPLIKDSFDKKLWSYFEIRKKNNFYGKKTLILSDVLILKFDDFGILSYYEVYDMNTMKKLNFSQEVTYSKSIDSSIINQLLLSSKKRLEMTKERLNKTNSNVQ